MDTCVLSNTITSICTLAYLFQARLYADEIKREKRKKDLATNGRIDREAWEHDAGVTYNLEPWNFGEFLDDMEQVEHEHYPSEPKAAHGHGIEPSSPAVAALTRDHYAYKSQEIQHLKEDKSDAIIIHETRGPIAPRRGQTQSSTPGFRGCERREI